MNHELLKDLSPEQLCEICIDMKEHAIDNKGPLGFNNCCYYWDMGRIAFALIHMCDEYVDKKANTFLGMDIRLNYSNPHALEIKEKPRSQYVVNLNTCYPSMDVSSLIKAANTIKKGFENMFSTLRNIEIVKVIFNEPATIVIWSDGTKTVVKAQNGETFDREKGLAMAICKKAFGNKGNYNEVFKKWVPEE